MRIRPLRSQLAGLHPPVEGSLRRIRQTNTTPAVNAKAAVAMGWANAWGPKSSGVSATARATSWATPLNATNPTIFASAQGNQNLFQGVGFYFPNSSSPPAKTPASMGPLVLPRPGAACDIGASEFTGSIPKRNFHQTVTTMGERSVTILLNSSDPDTGDKMALHIITLPKSRDLSDCSGEAQDRICALQAEAQDFTH